MGFLDDELKKDVEGYVKLADKVVDELIKQVRKFVDTFSDSRLAMRLAEYDAAYLSVMKEKGYGLDVSLAILLKKKENAEKMLAGVMEGARKGTKKGTK